MLCTHIKIVFAFLFVDVYVDRTKAIMRSAVESKVVGTSAILWESTEGQVASVAFNSGVTSIVSSDTETVHPAGKLFIIQNGFRKFLKQTGFSRLLPARESNKSQESSSD